MCTACSCSTDSGPANPDAQFPGRSSEFTVTGMTCGHCANSVAEAIQQLDGVSDVTIDLGSGLVSVISEDAVSEEAVTAAVRDAGYQVT